MLHHFNRKEAARILDFPPGRLRYWDRIGLIKPSLVEGRQAYYNFRDLICLRTAGGLVRRGLSAPKIKNSIQFLRAKFPEFDEQLSNKRISVLSDRVILSNKYRLIDTHSGQLLLKFDLDEFRQEIEAKLGSQTEPKTAQQWFEEGHCLDTSPEGFGEALEAYRNTVRLDPDFADAFVNMGRIYFHQKKYIDAQRCFRQALKKSPYHAKAAFNLANVLDELSCTAESVQWYERAIEAEPDFADVYFNLARATEKLGDWDKAVRHWKAYLTLDPSSDHAKTARKRIHLLQAELARG